MSCTTSHSLYRIVHKPNTFILTKQSLGESFEPRVEMKLKPTPNAQFPFPKEQTTNTYYCTEVQNTPHTASRNIRNLIATNDSPIVAH
jgi:hypothetical protein